MNNPAVQLVLLLIISATSHFSFVLKGFGEIDATKIAVSVIDMLNNGPDAAFSNFYFTDVIPLYILYLSLFMKMLNNNYSYLPLIMNYTNAVFGTLIVIPAFFLVRQLFGNSTIAFCSVLTLIFAPSFYQSTIMGFPHLIAFFFLLVSLWLYLSAIDHDEKKIVYILMVLSSMLLAVAFLFKSDYILIAGTYIALLFMRQAWDKEKITGAFLVIIISGVLFLFFRHLILGPSSGTTMSKEGMSQWYEYSLIIPTNLTYLIRQVKPVAYGAGVVTFFLGIISFIYFLLKRRMDLIAFVVSWAGVPMLFWLVMIGNNARHNMPTTLPLLVIIVIFLHERAPRFVTALTVILIVGNFFAVSPSFSILTPSGNLIASNTLLKDRMDMFQARAKEIADIDEDKVVVLGYFHNPHVIFEIMRSAPSYEAFKIGREDYRIIIGDREFVFLYFVVIKPEDMEEVIRYFMNKYEIEDHVFSSATYDLQSLDALGLKTITFDTIKKSTL